MPYPTLRQLIGLIEAAAPPALAEDWDNGGLATGDPGARVQNVVLALDATEKTVAAAAAKKAPLLLVHHPPLYKPAKTLREDRRPGSLLADAIRSGVAIYAAHTSFDSAPGGMNDYVAGLLGLDEVEPLQPAAADDDVKLVTFVPPDHAAKVAHAVFDAGGGVIGDYTHCSFRHPGTGSFLPPNDANPFSGARGKLSYEDELRLEIQVPRRTLPRAIEAMTAAHPYEEVAYDVYPLVGSAAGGLGRVGTLARSVSARSLAEACKRKLGIGAVRLVGPRGKRIRRVAVCTGGGGGLYAAAVASKADAYVTGDVNYHAALDALDDGIALIDAGHFGTEHIFGAAMKRQLAPKVRQAKVEVKFHVHRGQRDPFHIV